MILYQRLCESPGSKHNTLTVTELSAKGPRLHCLAGKEAINKSSLRRKQLHNEFLGFFLSKIQRGKKELTYLIWLHQGEGFTCAYPCSYPQNLAGSFHHTLAHRGAMERFVSTNANVRANSDSLH